MYDRYHTAARPGPATLDLPFAMARPSLTRTSFRLPEALVELLAQDLRFQVNASALVRATLDAFIAFDGRIRSARELNLALRCKVAATPVTLSCLHRELRHYRRFAKAQGHTFGALATSALCAAYGLPKPPAPKAPGQGTGDRRQETALPAVVPPPAAISVQPSAVSGPLSILGISARR
jgi:hypothetical protein